MKAEQQEKQYHVTGFTCAGCAGRVERHLREVPGVQDVEVNFAAAKLRIVSSLSREELEREAAKVEAIRLQASDEPEEERAMSFWDTNHRLITTLGSLVFLLGGWWVEVQGMEMVARMLLGAAVVVGGYAVARKGVRNLLRLDFDMNVLMTVAVTGALLIGEWREAAVVAFLFSISEMLESYSIEKARRSIRSLMSLAPKEAIVLRDGQEVRIQVRDVQIGDLVRVRPGGSVPIDGEIVEGQSSFQEAAITGESMPLEKQEGDTVYAGTLNGYGSVLIRVSRQAADTTIARIIHLVEEAQGVRAPAQQMIDRFARWYTPLVMVLAALTVLIPPLLFGAAWEKWIYEGLALLVVGCPCALVVSTPVAIVSAIGAGARNGVLIKGGAYLETVARLRVIAFDKTGTLTYGQPMVTDMEALVPELTERDVLQRAARLEWLSEHPLARAILARTNEEGMQIEAAVQFTAVPGKGACGEIDGQMHYIGKPAYIEEIVSGELPQERIRALEGSGKTVMLLSDSSRVLGLLAVADRVRPESSAVVRELKQAGLHTVMLTGDNLRTAEAIAAEAGIVEVEAGLLPEQKLDAIHRLRTSHGTVAMVGDGMNDAPALAAADIGIAMGGAGTDTALETADVALLADDLTKLPFLLRLGRASLAVIRQNIVLAVGLKLLAIFLVIPGWLTLWIAILSDMGATVLVTLNGIRLLSRK